MRLIVGLGNPGAAYAQTRHNAGMWVVERAAARWAGRLVRRGTAQRASVRHGSQLIELAGTLDFMNVTGAPLKGLLREYQLTTDDLILCMTIWIWSRAACASGKQEGMVVTTASNQ